jgi:AraC family transcriptional regulator of adaptative response/methylated-DNA-[protein]-cysteine methyltransferase
MEMNPFSVWKALLNIPKGFVVSYQDIASHIGRPKAFRAVANAIAINPVAYLTPCHRVIAKSGKTHQYRWGASRKKAIISNRCDSQIVNCLVIFYLFQRSQNS